MKGKRSLGVAYGVTLVALGTDLLSKYLVMKDLDGHAPIDVIGSLVKFTYVRNAGAAFGAGTSLTPVITVIALVAAVVTARFIAKAREGLWSFALGLL
ncbi:MAG: signal peptidase II, partial [Marmoricola sp.]